MNATEAQIEAQVRELFRRSGWYATKTDSGMVTRGRTRGRTRGHLPPGFPDLTMLRALPGTELCLAALIETKTAQGRLRDSQFQCHAELQDIYGLRAHIIRDPGEATRLILQGREVVQALRGLL